MSQHVITSAADSSQAQYFRCILTERRAELEARLAKDAHTLSARRQAGTTPGVKAIQYRVRKLQQQRTELDRLLNALDGLACGVTPRSNSFV